MARKPRACEISNAIRSILPEPSIVSIEETYGWQYMVKIECCGAKASFSISSDPVEFDIEVLRVATNEALHNIWQQGLH